MTQMAAVCVAAPHFNWNRCPRGSESHHFPSNFQDDLSMFGFIIWNANSKIRQNVDVEGALCNLPLPINEQETKTNTYSQSKVCNHSGLDNEVLLLMALL